MATMSPEQALQAPTPMYDTLKVAVDMDLMCRIAKIAFDDTFNKLAMGEMSGEGQGAPQAVTDEQAGAIADKVVEDVVNEMVQEAGNDKEASTMKFLEIARKAGHGQAAERHLARRAQGIGSIEELMGSKDIVGADMGEKLRTMLRTERKAIGSSIRARDKSWMHDTQ